MNMRENKYRAWDAFNAEMFPKKINDDLLVRFFTEVNKRRNGGNHVEVMQYTGLNDKNGKEIYFDCDIFRFKWMITPTDADELIGIMTWSDEDMRAEVDIYPVNNAGGYVCLSYIGNGQMFDFEVLGNKFENPDLLTTHNTGE
jgi:uncharacterized phage protein (TIGR01671 family)